MKHTFRNLKARQSSAALTGWRSAKLASRPTEGWLKTIREALGMTTTQLATRLGVTHSEILRLERAESNDAITLASLRKAAAAMGCELQYALIPKISIEETLRTRALEIARERNRLVHHTMSLENQAMSDQANKILEEQLAEELLRGPKKNLW